MERMIKGDYACKGLKSWKSRDGGGYQFNMYEKAKKVAFIHQDGRGGETEIDFDDQAASDRFDAFLGTLPHVKCEFTEEMRPVDDQSFVAELADEFEADKCYKRKCKTKTLIVHKDNKPNQFTEFPFPFTPKAKEHIVKKFGDNLIEIINERYL